LKHRNTQKVICTSFPSPICGRTRTSRQAKDANDPETFLVLLEKTGVKIETIDTALWDEETLGRLNEAVATHRERLDARFPRENSGPSTDLS
jgi:hypothetical protein